jgi:hypothetical protein
VNVAEQNSTASRATHSTPPRRRWWKIVAVVAATALLVLVIVAEYIVHHAEPVLRASVVDSLSREFHSPVQLDHLDISVVQGIEVRGGGLRITYLAGPGEPFAEQVNAQKAHQPIPPQLSVGHFSFRVSLHDLSRMQLRIAHVQVKDVVLHIPPHAEGGFFHGQPEPKHTAGSSPHFSLVLDHIHCQDAQLYIETDKPGKDALRFDIRSLDLTVVGHGQPFLYTADVINPHPIGDVLTSGNLGPWSKQDPRDTPVQGHFVFKHADLNTIKGISGILNATGDYSGRLGAINVKADTYTPDFSLDISGHPEHLVADVQATVDGTTGDTYLNQVQARLGNSNFTTQGSVVRIHKPDNTEGHDIQLSVQMPHGRIEDLLALSMKTQPPLMRGDVTMEAKLNIPPTSQRVADKLQLAGDLTIHGVEFENPGFQDKVDGLSMRAQGKPQDAKHASTDRLAEVASQMAVRFSLANALMTAPEVRYQIPGALVTMHGVYSLDGNVFEFKGHVRTQAEASQMVTGWKSWLLKPVDPFLKKSGAGLELPISVSGSHGNFHFGLAFGDADESTRAMQQDLRARRAVSR